MIKLLTLYILILQKIKTTIRIKNFKNLQHLQNCTLLYPNDFPGRDLCTNTFLEHYYTEENDLNTIFNFSAKITKIEIHGKCLEYNNSHFITTKIPELKICEENLYQNFHFFKLPNNLYLIKSIYYNQCLISDTKITNGSPKFVICDENDILQNFEIIGNNKIIIKNQNPDFCFSNNNISSQINFISNCSFFSENEFFVKTEKINFFNKIYKKCFKNINNLLKISDCFKLTDQIFDINFIQNSKFRIFENSNFLQDDGTPNLLFNTEIVNENQFWYFDFFEDEFLIRNSLSDLCIAIDQNLYDNDSAVIKKICDETDLSQLWKIMKFVNK